MRSKFDEQLNSLNNEMIHMGNIIEESIQRAVEALIRHDLELARKVTNDDHLVDEQQKVIENICFQLLMQQQPVAKDLRIITAALKMVTDMERIGDQAADICEIAIRLYDQVYIKKLEHINQMATETMLMLIQSIEAYVEKNIEKAKNVIEHDDIVDDLFNKVKNDLIEMIHKNPDCGEQAVDLLMVAKYFERIGDHATNIGEWVIFSIDNKVQKDS